MKKEFKTQTTQEMLLFRKFEHAHQLARSPEEFAQMAEQILMDELYADNGYKSRIALYDAMQRPLEKE